MISGSYSIFIKHIHIKLSFLMWMFLFLQSHSLQNKRSILSDQLQIFQAIPNAVVEHIRRNIICQFFDLRRSISHGNLCCSVFKHGKIIVAVSKTTVFSHGISNRRITAAIPTALLKPFGTSSMVFPTNELLPSWRMIS